MRLKIVNAKSPTTFVNYAGSVAVDATCPSGVSPGDPVIINGANSVANFSDNLAATIPHGIYGFCESKPTPTTAKVIIIGNVSAFAGLTVGAAYFISTAGGITTSAPTTGTVQQVGMAINSTTLTVNLMQPMRRA